MASSAFGTAVTGEVFAEAVRAENDAFGDETQLVRSEPVGKTDGERRGLRTVGEPGGFGRQRAPIGVAHLRFAADAEQEDTRRAERSQRGSFERLIFVALEIFARDERGERAVQRFIERGERLLLHAGSGHHGDGNDIAGRVERTLGNQLNLDWHRGVSFSVR